MPIPVCRTSDWCVEWFRKPWDVADFVVKQIKQLAAEITPYSDSYLKRLEDDGGLMSYRDEIRHQRAQYVKQQRESSFTFASPEDAARAIKNGAPSTPSDLLAFVVDHCNALSRELAADAKRKIPCLLEREWTKTH